MTPAIQASSVIGHPSSIEHYIKSGLSLVPIPPGSKGPRTAGWNKKENALVADHLPQGYGIGLAHAYSGTCALDIDNWDTASFMLGLHGVDIRELYDAADAVVIDSGKAGRGKLLYRLEEPLRTKRMSAAGQTSYELRCATANGMTVQDVLPPSIHPETQQPYRWAGLGHWTRIPKIPDALLAHWQELLKSDQISSIASSGQTLDLSWSELQRAVSFIDPGVTREKWIQVGMALHSAGYHSDNLQTAFDIWDDWSRQCPEKYTGNTVSQWKSFDATKEGGIKIGTLFALAKEAGYVRPEPDITGVFGPIKKTASSLMLAFRPSPPEIDLKYFPTVLARRVREVATGIGCDPVIPLWAGISAVCAVVDARTRLEINSTFQVPPVMWMMTIGSPGDKKTPGSQPMLTLLSQLEKEDVVNYAPAMLQYEALEAQYAAAHKHFKQASETSEGMLDPSTLPYVPPAPIAPVPLKLTVSDVTSQRLVRLAAERPRGLLCYLDEMNSWAHKMTSKTSGEDRATWLVAHGASSYDMERVGTGTTHADNLAVSIYGNIQPVVFHQNLDGLTGDGMLQRFLPCVIRQHRWGVGEPVPEYLSNQKEYEQMLRLIFALPVTTYRLGSDSALLFREFQKWSDASMHDIRVINDNMLYQHAFAKIDGILGRLILIDHVMTDPFSQTVGLDSVRRMIDFVQEYLLPSYRYVYGHFTGVDTFDGWIAEYVIRNSDKSSLTLSQIRNESRAQRKGLSAREQESAITGGMDLLESYNWLKMTHRDKDNITWTLNPDVAKAFEAERIARNEAKQRQMDVFCTRPKKQ